MSEDVETPPLATEPKADPDPSDITFGDDYTLGSIRSAHQISSQSDFSPSPHPDGSRDPPSSGPQETPFAPYVHEEASLMHDVDLMHDGLAEA